MPFENGVNWQPIDPDKRGRFASMGKAVELALKELSAERNDFYDSLVDNWRRLFPELPAWPGRYEAGRIYVYVANAPTLFMMRTKLPALRKRLAELPGAPKTISLRLEVHKPCS